MPLGYAIEPRALTTGPAEESGITCGRFQDADANDPGLCCREFPTVMYSMTLNSMLDSQSVIANDVASSHRVYYECAGYERAVIESEISHSGHQSTRIAKSAHRLIFKT